ncbi:MAG TPA: 16S rRNA (guanine(966)-N(2))-methyltransferase RsmD [Caldimonas sp.]|nr:16S rRNA (guanine(966)-N(2))-methyltransferase RsmD [Caldimonas sp.]
MKARSTAAGARPGARAAAPARSAASGPRRSAGSTLPHEVRVIGGAWKRSKLPVADRPGLRPTPDRVRVTLFNWLGQTLAGWRCVDAFAGSGALGFEAASRGAAEVVLIERDPVLVASLTATRQRLGAETVRIERADALQWLARAPSESFDLVFVDPPFDSPLLAPALAAAARTAVAGGFVYAEGPAPVGAPAMAAAGLEPWRSGRAGAVHFELLRKAAAG